VAVRIGDRFQIDFTQAATLAGIGSATASAQMILGLGIGSTAPGAGVVGAGAGGAPVVRVYAPNGALTRALDAFEPTFTGGVRVAVGDVNADGTPDLVFGSGPGRATLVRVLDGATAAPLFEVQPFEAAFTGGVYVAAGDLTGDGRADLVVTPDEGGGPRVLVYDGNGFALTGNFFGIADPDFRGGARPAVGDLSGDGRADLVVAAGFLGGPRVAFYDGRTVTGGQTPVRLFNDIFVFEQTLRNGIFVAAGDVNADGFADLVAGGGPGGGPRVLILSGRDLIGGNLANPAALGNFFAGDTASRSGVRVAARDLDADGRVDLLTGAGSGGRATAYLGPTIPASGQPPAFRDFFPFSDLPGGVFVG
jgi:hypothetical protein